jgi:hypothetical protein
MSGSQRVTNLLGYAGLIPFVIPALLVASDSGYAEFSRGFAGAYAFGIISFLTGSWWGLSLDRDSRMPLVLSNLYFLVALFIFVFATQWWALAAAVLLMSIFFAEQNSSLFSGFSAHYRKMRMLLTMVASASMLTLHLAS